MQRYCFRRQFPFWGCLALVSAGFLTASWHLSNEQLPINTTSHRVADYLRLVDGMAELDENNNSSDVDILYTYDFAELAMTNGVAQDNPDIIKYVRNNFLVPPVPKTVKYQLSESNVTDTSMGQSQKVLEILNNKTNGFFVECGALDGETRSNTLYMERFLGWEGLLVEADPSNFQLVTEKFRKAWLAPTCMSVKPFPLLVKFMQHFNIGKIDNNKTEEEAAAKMGKPVQKETFVSIQCIPFTSLLLALNRTHVDYFSLDVEGNELDVLKTIDFDLINIETLSVEYVHGEEGKENLRRFMESKGYEVKAEINHERNWANDFIFVKKK